MRHVFKILALVAMGVVVCSVVPEGEAASARGSIRGVVKDGLGNPLIGAAVLVLAETEEAKPEKVVKRASTDGEGKFTAAGIFPGRYKVKAEAQGFNPVEFAADVRPNKVTIFDSILLRRVGTLAEESSLNSNSKYAARKARGSIFHLEEATKEPAVGEENGTVALTDRASEMHGYVSAFSESTPSRVEGGDSFVGSNFAVSQQLGDDANLVISGQVGRGEGAPQRLQALTTAHANDRHKLAVALGYGRFTFSRRNGIPQLGQFSLSATDTWQVSGPVMIIYGVEFATFTEGASGSSLLPRLGLAVDAGPRTRLFAALTPGSSVDEQDRVNLESGEIIFSEPKPVARSVDNDPIMDRSYRLQFGAEQVLSEKSSVEMMAFFDTVSGHGMGLVAIPLANAQSEPMLRNEELSGRTRGVRMVYRHRVNSTLEGSVGYAFGEGHRLDPRGLTEPANLFS
ncbi:MAG TPA: carboxypeptidase-like regulatory domain-containing protein, partial [Blastocatellia bacterium]|nr:carboxypeptidase-like regulatory domain-containing protein [Blastocatellia bacterium]